MRCTDRHKRWRWTSWLAALLLAPTAAAGASGAEDATGIPTIAEARSEVARSEQRLADVTSSRDAARADLEELDARSAELAGQLADARAELRSNLVTAYVNGAPDETVLIVLSGEDVFDASARHHLLAHVAERSRLSVERYNDLKSQVDPDLVATAERVDGLERDVNDATNAVLAARANEAEAERQLALRQEAERQRRAALASAAAAAAAAATSIAPPAPVGPVSAAGALDGATAAPATPPVTAPPAPLPVVPAGGPSEAQWAALRNCESSGNYRAVSASGKYRGAYQFDYRTWAGLGGTGDPAAAPPAEQDARAKQLYAQRGWRPWPVCGRFLR